MAAQQYNFPSHKRGDTFNGVSFQVLVDGQPLDLTGASLRMQVRQNPKSPKPSAEFTLDNQGLLLTNAPEGRFQFPAQIINLQPYDYYYDIEFTLASGVRKTWITGRWPITSDVSR